MNCYICTTLLQYETAPVLILQLQSFIYNILITLLLQRMKKYTLKRNSVTKALSQRQNHQDISQNGQFTKEQPKQSFTHRQRIEQKQINILKNRDLNQHHYINKNQKVNHRFKAISFNTNKDNKQKNIQLITPRNHNNNPQNKTQKNNSIKKVIQTSYQIQKIFNLWRQYFKIKKQCLIFDSLSYSQMMTLLNHIGYIRNDCQSKYNISFQKQKEQLKKVYQLWNYLSVQNQYVRLVHLVIFVMVLQRIYIDLDYIEDIVNSFQSEMYTKYPIEGNNTNKYKPKHTFLIYDNKIFNKRQIQMPNQQIQSCLRKDFQIFKINKLNTKLLLRPIAPEEQGQTSITSLLSPKSYALAFQHRKQMFKNIKQSNKQTIMKNIDVYDLLTMNNNINARCQSHQHQDSEKPSFKTNKNLQIQTKFISLANFKEKINELSSPKFHYQKSSDQIIFEKQKEQYTFQPFIPKRRLSKKSVSQIKDLQKITIRMKTARDIKQDKQNLMKKGWACKKPNIQIENNRKVMVEISQCQKRQRRSTLKLDDFQDVLIFQKQYYQERIQLIQSKQLTEQSQPNINNANTQKTQISQKSSSCLQSTQVDNIKKITDFEQQSTTIQQVKRRITSYLKIPILYVDVNIQEGKKQRIVIFQDDSPKDLANNFGKKHNLPEQTIGRLQQMLIQQISTILVRIDEQTDQECSFL